MTRASLHIFAASLAGIFACVGDPPRLSVDQTVPPGVDDGTRGGAPNPTGDASFDPDSGVVDAGPRVAPDASEAGTPHVQCYPDRDEDGFAGAGAAIDALTVCPRGTTQNALPADCDDHDNRAFPGATASSTVARSGGGWDFDCDGKESLFAEVSGTLLRSLEAGGCGTLPVAECGLAAECWTIVRDMGALTPKYPKCGETQAFLYNVMACVVRGGTCVRSEPSEGVGYPRATAYSCR